MRASFQLMAGRSMHSCRKIGGRKAVIGAFVALATASASCLSVAFAQTDEMAEQAGAVISVANSHGDVSAYGAHVSVNGANAKVKAAGAVVEVRGAVDGRVWAAGADVTVATQAGGPVRAIGARVLVRGRIAGDVTAVGAMVDIDVASGGGLSAVGANVRIGAHTDIDRDLKAAGAKIVFDGQVGGDAKFAGALVTFNGRADGDVLVRAERLIVGPQAVISGDLTVRSLEAPEIDPGAEITGALVFKSLSSGVPIVEDVLEWLDDLPKFPVPIFAAVAMAAASFLAGLIFLIFARNTFGEAVDHVRFRPLSSLAYGIVSLFALIVLAALLMGSIVGFGLGVALLLLLPIVLVLGHATAVTGIVGWLLGRRARRLGIVRLLLFLILGALVVGFAGIIPFTGPGIVLVVLIFGVGAFLRAVLWRFRQTRNSGPSEVPPIIIERDSEPSEARSVQAPEVIIVPPEREMTEETIQVEEIKEPPERH